MQKQVGEALASLPAATIRELEELELPERMELLLNVSRDGENYREVGKLSHCNLPSARHERRPLVSAGVPFRFPVVDRLRVCTLFATGRTGAGALAM
jgi:hypothetical protein